MENDDVDIELFLQEMCDVEPLKGQDPLVRLNDSKELPGLLERRRAAEEELEDPNFLILSDPPAVAPYDPIEYKKEGVQQGVFRRLKQGKYPIDSILDLTRQRVKEARHELFRFINDSWDADCRTVLVLHGKGLSGIKKLDNHREASKRAILKSYTAAWLKQFPQVVAYHTAQKEHGGLTGVYVMLQKTQRLKDENRERFLNTRAR